MTRGTPGGEPGLEYGGRWEKVACSIAGSWDLRKAHSQGGQGNLVLEGSSGAFVRCVFNARLLRGGHWGLKGERACSRPPRGVQYADAHCGSVRGTEFAW